MQTALRKMGNSSGIILPRAILGQIGIGTGAKMDLVVENGRLIATPVEPTRRAHWAAAAADIAAHDDHEAADWRLVANADDDALEW